MVEGVLGHLCTKFCRNISNRLAAVRLQSRSSSGVADEVLEDGGSNLMVSTAAGGPLESAVSGRDGLSMYNGLVDAPEVVDMQIE